jgi:asparagine synthase (glutamine-hydrolysing)
MASALQHRGPDDHGLWVDPEQGIALSHARLAIIDLSAQGHQPMVSRSGRYVVVFNGEIYNFPEIRARLLAQGCSFRSHSDTEVLLEAIAAWGVEAAVRECVGMFAFAVWDRVEHSIVLGRDRMGEKPLYYGWIGSSFVFASELKALRAHPEWRGALDSGALTLYLRHSYVPGPYTIYEGIFKLRPGCIIRVARFVPGALPEPTPYWSLEDVTRGANDLLRTDEEAVDELERLLHTAVRQQMVADVPLGAFLSGGIDSSAVVALMQAQTPRRVRTFTIGFGRGSHNEAPAARRIATHLGTDHTELYIRPEDALAMIPELCRIYDEPFADSSQIPTVLVSQLARRSVTVSLSGDGGDELFAGYPTYQRGPHVNRRIGSVPPTVRRQLGRALLSRPVVAGLGLLTQRKGGVPVERALRLGEILEQRSPLAVHRALHSHWLRPNTVVRGGVEPTSWFTADREPWPGRSFAEGMLLTDAVTYLPDDLLVKVDRAAMSVSLETRVPLLDHRVVEFAMRLPWHMKVRGGVTKWILRQVLYRHVPRELVDGPKQGFAVPMAEWLRGPLRDWAGELLDRRRIEEQGFFHSKPIEVKWSEHQKGLCDWSYPLWSILMFQAWLEAQGEATAALQERPAESTVSEARFV